MKHTKYLLYITFIFVATAGISACSQQKQSEAKSTTDAEPISVTMYKNPDCQCCEQWAAYMEQNGYDVTSVPSKNLTAVKSEKKVPEQLRACHTALVDGYVVEGHVPVEAINKLLKEHPDARGIAVPGMPAGAPGTQGNRSAVDVYFFNGSDQVAYFDKF